MLSRLSIASFLTGLISGIYSVITWISLFVLYLDYKFSIYPYDISKIRVLGYFIGFS